MVKTTVKAGGSVPGFLAMAGLGTDSIGIANRLHVRTLDAAFNNAGVQSPLAETANANPEDYDRDGDQPARRLELHEV